MKRIFPLRRTLRAIALLSFCLLPVVAQGQPANPATPAAELRERIEAHIKQARFSGALWSVKIVSLDTGRTLFEHDADRLMSPASNAKLYVGALALDRFGGDYRIVTPIQATAAPDRAGKVKGDVIVRGRGDPSWKSGPGRTDFRAIFEPFVAVLTKAGVRRITGDIVADATYFQSPPNGAGWTADDLNDDYGAEISAVALEDNYAGLRITPAARAGQPCELALLQPHTGLVLDNRTVTTAEGGPRRIAVRRIFGENTLHVWGGLPVGGKEEIFEAPVPRPAGWFAAALKAALGQRGIRVDGQARSLRWPEPSAGGANCIALGEVSSPPMRELVAAFMKPSQNLETDLIFAHLGESLRAADAPAWRTSEEIAVEALEAFLRKNGLPAAAVRFEEGSGLSRNNLTTANATVAVLKFMAAHRDAGVFVDSLPVAGVDGTLRRRMQGTPAEGNVRAKTGSLRYAKALSGYVTSAAGERLAFSLMLNRDVVPPGRNGREELDAIAVLLAGFGGRLE
ncbi:MAG: D-alanyl-D-alanine carboxypeptidase/D-alanyl-D-alanine-endopeptidase [Verrucomicrobia bacterium]|nr:D-alanyl-D-alanine carboxypeptidase/D-alanyl-D-alanine-endopeptidase [Verrucomicrobiota bacterium]